MKRSDMRLVEEQPTHFVVHDGQGTMEIAKSTLDDATVHRIRGLPVINLPWAPGMPEPPEKSDGGTGEPPKKKKDEKPPEQTDGGVPHLAGGGTPEAVTDENGIYPPLVNHADGVGPPPGFRWQDPADPNSRMITDESQANREVARTQTAEPEVTLGDTRAAGMGAMERALAPEMGAPGFGSVLASEQVPTGTGTVLAPTKPPADYKPDFMSPPLPPLSDGRPPASQAAPDGVETPITLPPVPQQPAVTARRKPAGGAGAPAAGATATGPQTPPPVDADTQAQIDANQRETDAKVAQQKAAADIEDNARMAKAIIAQRRQADLADNQARADQHFDAYMNGKLDPYKSFHEMSTGGKIMAGIGLLLGIGPGPNPAVAAMDRIIDRDVETQKYNLDKERNAVRYYMDRGNSINEAADLAKADALDAAAAALKIAAAGNAPPQLQAQHDAFAADLRQKAKVARATVELNKQKVQNDTVDTQTRAAVGRAQVRNYDADSYARLHPEPKAAKGTAGTDAGEWEYLDPNDRMTPFYRALASKPVIQQEAEVRIPMEVPYRDAKGNPLKDATGAIKTHRAEVVRYIDPKLKKDFFENTLGLETQQGRLAQLQEMARQHPMGTIWPDPDKRAIAEALVHFNLSSTRNLDLLKRNVNQTEFKALTDAMADPSSVSDSVIGAVPKVLKVVQQLIDDRRKEVYRTYIKDPPKFQPGHGFGGD